MPIFGSPPLLAGENAGAYDELLAAVSGNLKPADIFEEVWVREIVDLIWEILRWRQHLVRIIAARIPKALERILEPVASNEPAPTSHDTSFMGKLHAAKAKLNSCHDLVKAWTAGERTAIERVQGMLVAAGLTMESVVAQAAASELDKIERFNRLIASAEWRRNVLLREIDRHRPALRESGGAKSVKSKTANLKLSRLNPLRRQMWIARPPHDEYT